MSSSELHLLYVLGTISLMLGLTESPVIEPCALTLKFAAAESGDPSFWAGDFGGQQDRFVMAIMLHSV